MTLYHKKGIPEDLYTSETENEREIKVSPVANEDFETFFNKVLLEQNNIAKRILKQLELLNARFEDTFETDINEVDL